MFAEKSSSFIVIFGLFCFFLSPIQAQFSSGPQDVNSIAIHKNDTSFSFWANEIQVERGWQKISDTTIGKSNFGVDTNVLGKANSATISLGDAGFATLKFPFKIYNVDGFDFAVFENGIKQTNSLVNEYFLELARVEVSENGIDFFEFESTSNTLVDFQIGTFEQLNCTKINNLAGNFPLNYGTPFDLDELGLDSIISIRITDVVGSIDSLYATYDSQGNMINDPFPTAFGSSGFDLNAVGALNQPNVDTTLNDTLTNVYFLKNNEISIYPNPIKQNSSFNIECFYGNQYIEIFSILGELIHSSKFNNRITIETNGVQKGLYFIRINKSFIKKIIIN